MVLSASMILPARARRTSMGSRDLDERTLRCLFDFVAVAIAIPAGANSAKFALFCRVHPLTRAVRPNVFFPNGHVRLYPFNGPAAPIKRRFAMFRRHGHKDRRFAEL